MADNVVAVRVIYAEARAALAQATRSGRLSAADLATTIDALEGLFANVHLLEDECLVRRAGELAQHHGLRCYDAAHLAAAERIRVGATVMGAGDENPCTSPETLGPAVADTSGKGGAGQPQRPVSPPIRGGSGYLLAQHLTAEVLGSGKTETLRLGLDG